MSSMSKKLFTRSKTQKKKGRPNSRDDIDMDHHMYAALSRKGSTGTQNIKSSNSNSLGSVTSEPNCAPLEQEDFLSLMHDVRNFSDALGKLKEVFQPFEEGVGEGDTRVSAHEKLGEVLSVLRSVLHKCPALHTTDVLTDAVVLISKIKGFHYEDVGTNLPELYASIDQLALNFSISVSEYLMGDVDTYPLLGKTKSYDNLATANSDLGCSDDLDSRDTGEELDAVLLRLEYGMDMALSWAKASSKYIKEILNYIEKRASLESDFAKGLSKLAMAVRQTITEDSCLPFQSIYCSALEHDLDLARTTQISCTHIQTDKFIEPLTQMRQEHEKMRKCLKEHWTRELRKMQEAVGNLRKARSLYVSRQQEYEKAKEATQRAESEALSMSSGLTKADRKKKAEEEAMHRALEAETAYKGSVTEANNRQKELERTKAENLAKIRDLIHQCDQTMKTVTVTYFQLQQNLTAPLPVQYNTLYTSSRLYELGCQYDEFVRRLTVSTPTNNNNQHPFVFEPYRQDGKSGRERKQSTQSSGSGSSDMHLSDDSPDKQRGPSPLKAWSAAVAQSPASDTDSISGSSCKSHESSPSASPCQPRAAHLSEPPCDEPDKDAPSFAPPGAAVSGGQHDIRFRGIPLSRTAQTHVFKKLRTPSRCRQCESYVYFHGAECEKCGLTSHRRCLESLHWECGHECNQKPLQRRMTTFGVDLNLHVQETQTDIPILVQKCCAEIDQRGLDAKGIYRLSGVKSRVEKLCQSFEIDEGNVDLNEHHSNVIANVLKLYLRQLPEPLLTYRLYPDLLNLIKEELPAEGTSEIKLVQRLNSMLADLPTSNFRTLSLLMHHLKRVTEHEEANQMSASNLGIVFGPTLLRPSDGAASLNSLMETPHQTKIVELLITHVEYVFGPEEKPPEQIKQVAEAGKQKETTVETLADSGATSRQEPQPLDPSPATDSKDDNATSISGDSKWYVSGEESLLDELAREEPRFIQSSGDFVILPGSTGAAIKPGDNTEHGDAKPELHKEAPPSGDGHSPAVVDVKAMLSDVGSDEELPLPDDSNASSLSSFSCRAMAGSLVAPLVGVPALGPTLVACTNLSFTDALPVKYQLGPPTVLITTATSSPGLKRKLLPQEVLSRAHSSSSINAAEPQDAHRVSLLSQPRHYPPPVHRSAFRIRRARPNSRTCDSLDLAVLSASLAVPQTRDNTLSQSTFYAQSVIQSEKSSSTQHVDRQPEFV